MKGSVVTVVRRLMSAAVIVPCVAGSIALGGSAQAAVVTQTHLAGTQWAQAGSGQAASAAAGEILSPSNGQVVTSGSVQVSARTSWAQLSMALYVDGPSTSKTKVASGGANQTLSGTFDAGSAPNGTFTVTLAGEITKTVYETSTFKLRRPAAEPSGVAADMQGKDKIQVTWNKGSEPDLQSYEVFTSQSGSLGQVAVDKACSGSSCQAVLAVPAKAAGQRVGFLVRAYRSDGDGGTLGSGSSNTAFVNVPAPPAPQPTKSAQPTQQANTNKQTNKTEPLPEITNKDKKVTPTVKPTQQTVPKDTDKLPTMPATDKKGNFTLPPAEPETTTDATAEDGALASGTDDDPKGDDTKTVDTGVKAQSSESPIGNIGQYGLFIAGGLILLLLAAHGGAWARRRALAAAGGAGGSSAGGSGVGPTLAGPPPAQNDLHPHLNDSIPPTATVPRRPAVVLAVAKPRQPQPQPPVPEPTPMSLPIYLSTQDVRPSRDDIVPQQAGGGRQEPVRLALPSSAVTVVPEQVSAVAPPAVRLEDRWDDYLPPSPRSMEDSGFWERPQPGAGDFWAADDDEDGYNGRRRRGDES